jgi:hypothetical protein
MGDGRLVAKKERSRDEDKRGEGAQGTAATVARRSSSSEAHDEMMM